MPRPWQQDPFALHCVIIRAADAAIQNQSEFIHPILDGGDERQLAQDGGCLKMMSKVFI